MSGNEDEEKQHEPTQKKLDDARRKGEFARSTDLNTAASYIGLSLCALALGSSTLGGIGQTLTAMIERAEEIAPTLLDQRDQAVSGHILTALIFDLAPWFGIPALVVLLSILVQRSLVFAPEKLQPKLSRISPISNAKNKFGRSGLFEFSKSAGKLFVYAMVLSIYLVRKTPDLLGVLHYPPAMANAVMLDLALDFLLVSVVIAVLVGGVDYMWQFFEHLRRHRMSHNELKEEVKQAEGDPQTKQQRRQKGTQIALNQMLSDVPDADVVIVNPTHYAVALKWDRSQPGAPVCVAKGTDEIARKIREKASESGVPLHSDPPTARALFTSVEIGQEILPDHYRAVAAAIRFAEEMRKRRRGLS